MIEPNKMTDSSTLAQQKAAKRRIYRNSIANISLSCFLGVHKKCDKIAGDCDCECHPANRFVSKAQKLRSDGRFNKQ